MHSRYSMYRTVLYLCPQPHAQTAAKSRASHLRLPTQLCEKDGCGEKPPTDTIVGKVKTVHLNRIRRRWLFSVTKMATADHDRLPTSGWIRLARPRRVGCLERTLEEKEKAVALRARGGRGRRVRRTGLVYCAREGQAKGRLAPRPSLQY
jgi:hypothetical protein